MKENRKEQTSGFIVKKIVLILSVSNYIKSVLRCHFVYSFF